MKEKDEAREPSDLDRLGPVLASAPAAERSPTLVDPIKHKREDMRTTVGGWLVAVYAGLNLFALVAFALIAWKSNPAADDPELKQTIALFNLRETGLLSVLQMTLSPLVGLVGTMLGFYFGRGGPKG